MEEKKKLSEEGEKKQEQTEQNQTEQNQTEQEHTGQVDQEPLVTGETTTWDFTEEIREKLVDATPLETRLTVFQPPAVIVEDEEEKQNKFLIWLGQKKVLVTALICLFIMVSSTFIVFSYKWITESEADKQPKPVKPQEKPAHLIFKIDNQIYDLDLKTVGYNGTNLETTNETKLRAWLDDVKKKVDIPVQNATQKKFGGPIHPAITGRFMDTAKINTWLANLGNIINKAQDIPTIMIKPTVTQADFQHIDENQIGSYTTHFDAGNTNRTTNIKLASEAINNLILPPGKIFSFNKVVGERTAERGYKVAHVIVKGEFSEGIGGGICQVSSTLYNSVDEAGLKIVRRFSHSAKVTYVPPGRDATVSWGGPDFRFKNNLNKPILLRIEIHGGKITIKTFTATGAKVTKKKVEEAPATFSEMQVTNDQPTEKLPTQQN